MATVLIVGAVSAPAIGCQWLVFRLNPVFQEKALTLTKTPPVWGLLFSWGLVFLLALIGAAVAVTTPQRLPRFAWIWVVINLVMIYLPVPFQRKMVEGLHIPLCFLAAVGVDWLLHCGWRMAGCGWRKTAALAVVVLLTVPSQCAFLKMAMNWVIENNESRWRYAQPPYFLPNEEWAALRYLRENASDHQAILCTPLLGSHVPAVIGRKVYVGHWAETLRFGEKLGEMDRFYNGGMSPEEMRQFLRAHRIGFVLADANWQPPPFLREALRRGETVVCQVVD